VDALLEAPPDGRIEGPRQIRGREDEDPGVVVANAVHLYKELGFHARRVFVTALEPAIAIAAEGIDLVDEDDRRFLLASELEEVFDKSGDRCVR
jgi:hypothetical protein